MSPSRQVPRYRRGANAIAALAAAALVALGLVAVVATPSQATTKLPLQFSASTASGTALTGDALNVGLTITNPASNRVVKLNHFAIVIPLAADGSVLNGIQPGSVSGVGVPIRGSGASGPGNWSETIRSCGRLTNCSAIVVIDAAVPRNKSGIAPGQSVTAYVGITAPGTPQTLTFRALECDDDFVLPSTASINVVSGDAARFLVKETPTSVTAGGSIHFTVQGAAGDGVTPRAYKGGTIHLTFGQDDKNAKVTSTTAGVTITPDGLGKGGVNATVPATASGQSYSFDAQVFAETTGQASSVTATDTAGVTGTSNDFTVSPGPAASITLDSVSTTSATFTAGDNFVTSWYVTDTYGNPIATPASSVTLTEDGAGTLTANAGDLDSTVTTDGTKNSSYSQAGVINLTAHLGSLDSNTVPVTFVAFTTSTTVPVGGTIQTQNFVLGGSCAAGDNCSTGGFPNGATGNVTISMGTCNSAGCDSGGAPKAADLEANLKDPATGDPLYSASSPATLTYVCTVENCPIGADDQYGQASDYPGGVCPSYASFKAPNGNCYNLYNQWEESVEDAQSNGIIAKGSTDSAFYQVQACQSYNGSTAISGFDENHPVGSVTTVPAGVKSCIDLTQVTRNLTTGDLTFVIYFYDDYIACRC